MSSSCITEVAATVAAMLGINVPNGIAPPIDRVIKATPPLQRVLMFNPDAIAAWIFKRYAALLAPAIDEADITVQMRSVMPCVTPVCFASMYSGLMPSDHGIVTYEKPVLTVTTLFDMLIAAGKKPAIVSTTGDSISQIFLQRDMDYFLFDTVEEVNRCACELIIQNRHDLIVVYNGNYDYMMHRCGPEGQPALDALRSNAAAFAALCKQTDKYWANYNRAAVFAPDHGCHAIDGGCGSHGLDMPQDMDIVHLYRFRKKN